MIHKLHNIAVAEPLSGGKTANTIGGSMFIFQPTKARIFVVARAKPLRFKLLGAHHQQIVTSLLSICFLSFRTWLLCSQNLMRPF